MWHRAQVLPLKDVADAGVSVILGSTVAGNGMLDGPAFTPLQCYLHSKLPGHLDLLSTTASWLLVHSSGNNSCKLIEHQAGEEEAISAARLH